MDQIPAHLAQEWLAYFKLEREALDQHRRELNEAAERRRGR